VGRGCEEICGIAGRGCEEICRMAGRGFEEIVGWWEEVVR